MKWAFSKSTRTDDEANRLLRTFRDAGYDGLQLKAGQYRACIERPDLFLEKWGRFPGAASALITSLDVTDRGAEEALRRVAGFGRRVGSEMMVACISMPREGLEPGAIRKLGQRVSDFGMMVLEYGLRLSVHNHFGQPLMYRDDIEAFFSVVREGSVGLTLDTAHAAKSGILDLHELIVDMAPVIDNFHLKDLKDGEFAVLGEGTIDFAPVFGAIRAIDYGGWVSADEESGADLNTALRACLKTMKDGLS